MASYIISTRSLALFSFVLLLLTINTDAKIYDRCELARELREVHEIPDKQIATWVCLARHESEFNTSAINHGSGDHGLFQISQLFWCSPPGYACGISCDDLHDDNIEDDVICARRVYREHRRLSGDGFNAWVVYNLYCKNKTYAESFLEGCFEGGLLKSGDEDEEVEKDLPTIDYFPHILKPTRKPNDDKKPTIDYFPHILKPTRKPDGENKLPTIDYFPHILKPTRKPDDEKELPIIDYFPHILKPTTLNEKPTIDYFPHILKPTKTTIKTTTETYNSLVHSIFKTPTFNQITTKRYQNQQTTKKPFTKTHKPISYKPIYTYTTTDKTSTIKPFYYTTTTKPFTFTNTFKTITPTTTKPYSFKTSFSTKFTFKPFVTSTSTPFTTKSSTNTDYYKTTKSQYFTTKSGITSKRPHRFLGNKNEFTYSMSSNGFQLFKTDTL